MKKGYWILNIIYASIFIVALLLLFQNMNLRKTNQEYANRNDELNREIGEYKAMEDFYWEYTKLLDEIYRGKINEAVLEERIKWLEQYTEWLEERETVSDGYTQEEMYEVIEEMIYLMLEVNTDEMLDVDYNEKTKIFVIIQYNQYGKVFDTYTYTLDEIIHEILGGKRK